MKVVRKPKLTEVADIKRLLDSAAEGGDVLRRPLMELYESVRDFYTYVDEQGVAGCCALHIDMLDLAEVRSLVVRPDLRGQGIGARLLETCLAEAQSLNIRQVYALTRNPAFFGKHGFQQVEKHDLPHKVFNDCVRCPLFPDCDEIAMMCTLPTNNHEAAVGKNVARQQDAKTLNLTLGFLGFGNMGSAIVRGLLSTHTIEADRVLVYDVAEDKRAAASPLGVRLAASPGELAAACDAIVLAVKPQVMAEALEQIKPALRPDTLVISIAAGISIDYLQTRLRPASGEPPRVVRVMPNTPALVEAGAAGIALSTNCTEADAQIGRTIFEAVGLVEVVSEERIDVVTALSGSGPAYFFYMVECLVQAAQAQGLNEAQAVRLAARTLLGSGRLLEASGESPAVLRERVTSKGGTTAAALDAFRAGGFERVIAAGVEAAVARAKELGR